MTVATYATVLKPFGAGGFDRQSGEVIDVAEARPRAVRTLVESRHLSTAALPTPPLDCACGSQWVDGKAKGGHVRSGECQRRQEVIAVLDEQARLQEQPVTPAIPANPIDPI